MTHQLHKTLVLSGVAALAFGAALIAGPAASLAQTNLRIESWRNDDIDIWNDKIIPAFSQKHPDWTCIEKVESTN